MTDVNKKVANLINLSAIDRYTYFIRKVSDFEIVWGLYSGEWAMAENDYGTKAIAIWPEEPLAKICAVDIWETYHPKSITLDDFIENWLVEIEEQGLKILVFPTPSDKGIVVTSTQLKNDIEEETAQYY